MSADPVPRLANEPIHQPGRLRIGEPTAYALWLPGKYIQGAGAINEIGEHVARLGDRALLLGGRTALSVSREAIAASLERRIEDGIQG